MDLQRILAIHYAPELGMRGACTTIRDLAAYRRAGLLRGEPLPYHVKLVTTARVESANHRGAGNRWRRRFNRLVASFPALMAPHPHMTATEVQNQMADGVARIVPEFEQKQIAMLTPFLGPLQRAADLAHDVATQGRAKRLFRVNPHD